VEDLKEEGPDFNAPVGYYESNDCPFLHYGYNDVLNLHGPGDL
jgi:hypothetical protein